MSPTQREPSGGFSSAWGQFRRLVTELPSSDGALCGQGRGSSTRILDQLRGNHSLPQTPARMQGTPTQNHSFGWDQ
jgi:hypothetical protein